MSSEQLQSIFHVESQDLVPHYEVIHLVHHGTSERSISKRSISPTLPWSSGASAAKNSFFDEKTQQKLNSHHVKKDLSKSAYYSELKKVAEYTSATSSTSPPSSTGNNVDDESNLNNVSFNSNNNKSQLIKNKSSDSKLADQNLRVIEGNQEEHQLPFHSLLSNVHKFDENVDDIIVTDDISTKKFSVGIEGDDDCELDAHKQFDLSDIKEHNVSLNVFGEVFNLTLRPTANLFKNGPQSLKMFTVVTSPNSTHGLDYEEVEEVSMYLEYLMCLRSNDRIAINKLLYVVKRNKSSPL